MLPKARSNRQYAASGVSDQARVKSAGAASRVTVSIMGDPYTIRGDAEAGYIKEVSELVENRIQSLRNASREMSRLRLAVLAAVNIADELLQERMKKTEDRGEQEDDELARKTRQLISLLDEGLIGDTLDGDDSFFDNVYEKNVFQK
jgi:cell division protein ZapA